MLGKVKSFFSFLAAHWVMALVFVALILTVAYSPLAKLYNAVASKVPGNKLPVINEQNH